MERRCKELFHRDNVGKIYLVFDGKRCPLKAVTNDDREARRRKNLTEARMFKRQGRRDKAEEKYKMCIKIHSAFADAVAAALKRIFAKNNCFQCIFSPYEADAQLVKLCVDGHTDAIITEDSDVVVYCAVCHVSAPVIFKLDRRSGICDIAIVDWLLNGTHSNEKDNSQKKTSALESICISFSHRQKKRAGEGVRLFVQACILAGSDYSPSKLSGVGLVTAFKLVRDNAHRDCNDRFRQVLRSLSKKNRRNEDMEVYEENLAQSEAVFYLHPVLDISAGRVITLTTPKLSQTHAGEMIDYAPLLERFRGDLDFLGNVDIHGSIQAPQEASQADDSPITRTTNFPVEEIEIRREKKRKRDHDHDTTRGGNVFTNKIQISSRTNKNPYRSKQKPLKDSTNDTRSNPFDRYFHKPMDHKSAGAPSSPSFLNNRSDFRFTKRKFDKTGKPVSNPRMKMSIHDLIQKSHSTEENVSVGTHSQDEEIEERVETLNPKFQPNGESSVDFELHEGKTDFSSNSSRFLSLNESENIDDRYDAKISFHSINERMSTIDSVLRKDSSTEVNDFSIYDEKCIDHLDDCESQSESDNVINCSLTRQDQKKQYGSKRPGGNGLTKSKHFSRYSTSARRVTLDQPQITVDELEVINDSPISATTEFKNVGTYVDVRTSAQGNTQKKASSPGNSSVISEIGECPAQLINNTSSLKENLPHNRDFECSSSTTWSAKTPFQNNFNPVRLDRGRSSSSRGKQTTLFDAWSGCSSSSSSKMRRVASRRSKIEPLHNKITDHFYSSVLKETISIEDDDFMGL